jgi:hypothetical protein
MLKSEGEGSGRPVGKMQAKMAEDNRRLLEYRRKHGKGPYNLLPGEELC